LNTSKPKINQQVRTKTHTFPTNESLNKVVGGHKNKSKKRKKGEGRPETWKMGIF
jgi:hypothetical protein